MARRAAAAGEQREPHRSRLDQLPGRILTALITLGVRAIAGEISDENSSLKQIGGLVSTSVSGLFLVLLGLINLVILVQILRVFRDMRRGRYDEASLEGLVGEGWRQEAGVVRHGVTNHRIENRVSLVRCEARSPVLEWFAEGELARLPIPTPQRRALALAKRL